MSPFSAPTSHNRQRRVTDRYLGPSSRYIIHSRSLILLRLLQTHLPAIGRLIILSVWWSSPFNTAATLDRRHLGLRVFSWGRTMILLTRWYHAGASFLVEELAISGCRSALDIFVSMKRWTRQSRLPVQEADEGGWDYSFTATAASTGCGSHDLELDGRRANAVAALMEKLGFY